MAETNEETLHCMGGWMYSQRRTSVHANAAGLADKALWCVEPYYKGACCHSRPPPPLYEFFILTAWRKEPVKLVITEINHPQRML